MSQDYETLDPMFPSVAEIQRAVENYIRVECKVGWPEDEWFSLNKYWRINVWKRDGKGPKLITTYPIIGDVVEYCRGIRIPVKKEVKK